MLELKTAYFYLQMSQKFLDMLQANLPPTKAEALRKSQAIEKQIPGPQVA